jgi:mono/diheme cytochrome c family protein
LERALMSGIWVSTLLLGCPAETEPIRPPTSNAALVPRERYARDVEPIFRRKCFDCHHGGTEPPWYAAIPIAGAMISRDIEWGRQRLDLQNPYPFVASDEVGRRAYLIGLRTALLDDTMPPRAYLLTHPFGFLRDSERELILAWLEDAIESLSGAVELESSNDVDLLLFHRVKKLVRNRCARCHRSSVHERMNGAFDYVTDLAYLSEGDDYVFPGNLDESLLYKRITDPEDSMPPSPNDHLSPAEVERIRAWIEAGAPTR